MRLTKTHGIGIATAVLLLILATIFFKGSDLFYFLLSLAVVIGVLPFVLSLMLETEREREKEEMFLEFIENVAESVASGTPISKSILTVKDKEYRSLSPHVQKLASQIALGIPVRQAFEIFARDVKNDVITRAITLMGEAEKAGGNIEEILDSTVKSVNEIEKLRKERRSAIYNMVVQGYIIFFIFIAIMLVMEFKILPMASGLGDIGSVGMNLGDITQMPTAGGSQALTPEDMAKPFLVLLITQAIFTGLTIGKISEGSLKAGVKHSFLLAMAALLISTGVRAFIGGV